MATEAIPLGSKPRFEILDGLRGVAAMIVVAFHFSLYITHYPMIYVQMNWAARHPDAPLGTHIWVAVSIFIASIAVAYASVKVYDLPMRAWLSERFIHRCPKA